MQTSDLDEAPLAGKLQVQVFGDGGPGDSVGHVGAGQELVAQVQQLDVQRHGLLPLQMDEGAAFRGRRVLMFDGLLTQTGDGIPPVCRPGEFH